MLTKVLQMGGVRKVAGTSPERELPHLPYQYETLQFFTLRPDGEVRVSARLHLPAINKALKKASDNLDVQLGVNGIQFAEQTNKPSRSGLQGMLLTLHLL